MLASVSTTSCPVNDDRRYVVRLLSFYCHKDYILYQATILDSAFSYHYTLHFRFRALK